MIAAILGAIASYIWYVAQHSYLFPNGAIRRYHLLDLSWLARKLHTRWKWEKVFLHHMLLPDSDQHLHNHPWYDCAGFVLWGWYTERRWFGVGPPYINTHFAGTLNRMYECTYHKIINIAPNTWTLFFCGRRDREWGFLVEGKHVDWWTYLGVEWHDIGD